MGIFFPSSWKIDENTHLSHSWIWRDFSCATQNVGMGLVVKLQAMQQLTTLVTFIQIK